MKGGFLSPRFILQNDAPFYQPIFSHHTGERPLQKKNGLAKNARPMEFTLPKSSEWLDCTDLKRACVRQIQIIGRFLSLEPVTHPPES